MRRVHLATVGASLISNASRNWESVKPILDGLTIDGIERKLGSGEINRNHLHKELVEFLRKEGERASAEIASMSKFLKNGDIDFIYLMYTDTNVGDVCSRALETYLRGERVGVQRIPVEGYANEETFTREGLGNLARNVWEIINRHKSDRVYVCATGGFKPETSIITLIANIKGIPVYYRHETFRAHVAIPGLPITWRPELKEKYDGPIRELKEKTTVNMKKFYEQFGQEVVDEMENKYWLITRIGDSFQLTPIGDLLYGIFLGG